MSNDFKVTTRPKIFKESGSALDATDIESIKERAGSHDNIPSRNIDVSAFSHKRQTNRQVSTNFMKKGTGTGGTLQAKAAEGSSAVPSTNKRLPKLMTGPLRVMCLRVFRAAPVPPRLV